MPPTDAGCPPAAPACTASSSSSPPDALRTLAGRTGVYDHEVLERFGALRRAKLDAMSPVPVRLESVAAGMMLGAEVRLPNGVVLAPRGARVTPELLLQMRSAGLRPESTVRVLMRQTGASAA